MHMLIVSLDWPFTRCFGSYATQNIWTITRFRTRFLGKNTLWFIVVIWVLCGSIFVQVTTTITLIPTLQRSWSLLHMMVALIPMVTTMPTPRGINSSAPLILCPMEIIPRAGRTGILITLTHGQHFFSLLCATTKHIQHSWCPSCVTTSTARYISTSLRGRWCIIWSRARACTRR